MAMYFLYSNDSIRAYICISVINLLLAIPILVMGTWLTAQPTSTSCETFLSAPLIALGALVIIMCIAGIYYAVRIRGLQLCCHGYIMFVLLCVLLGYSIFALAVTGAGSGERLPGKGYKEYRLDDYSKWLRNRVNGTKHWRDLKNCVFKSNVCSKFQAKYENDSREQFFSRSLSSIESGCCKPSNECNFNYTSPTEWMKPKDGVYTNMDCTAWDNNPSVLCFDCQSCKAGLADDVKRKWRTAGIVSIIFVILLIIFSFMGCIVIENPS